MRTSRLSLLLSVLVFVESCSDEGAKDNETVQDVPKTKSTSYGVCYPELGCFSNKSPWHTLLRPFPAPFSPQRIDTRLYYYSRTSLERFNITLWPNISLNGADYKADRPKTAFIVHGFSSSGNQTWLSRLKDAYLKRVDANVFLVDWGKGAQKQNYLQVASNTRIVGAEITRFVNWLIKNQTLNVSSVHLMGHSLGAHICSYVGKSIHNISRITGFDPAGPGFELAGKAVRIDKSDANFVEILHTNSEPLIPLLGFGLIRPRGHVDFYMNGGLHQPGCRSPIETIKDLGHKMLKLTSIKDLFHWSVEEVHQWVKCSHGRSYLYYTDALNNTNCSLWGQKANLLRRLIDAGTVGWLEPLFTSLHKCTEETCLPVGLDTPHYKARGAFAVITARTPPYCNVSHTPAITRVLKSLNNLALSTKKEVKKVEEKVKKGVKKVKDKIKKTTKKIKNKIEEAFG